jgi:hypothetical protein
MDVAFQARNGHPRDPVKISDAARVAIAEFEGLAL